MAEPTSTVTASELIREKVLTTLVLPLQAQSVFLASGPRIIDTPGPLVVPHAAEFEGALPMTGENELIPELDAPDFTDQQLLPSTMKSFKAIHRYSIEAVRQSSVALESVLRDSLVRRLAADVDKQFMGSTGDGVTTPRGMGAWEDVQTLPVDGPLLVQHVLDAQGLLLSANAATEGLTLFVRVSDYMRLRSQPNPSGGGWVLQQDVNTGKLVVPILGATVVPTDRIAEGTAYLAHMPSIIVARDCNPRVTILTERYADFDQIGIRAVSRLDAAPIYPEAVVRFTGITAGSAAAG